jgi:hypothetical protein
VIDAVSLLSAMKRAYAPNVAMRNLMSSNKTLRKNLKRLKKLKVKVRIPTPPPSKRFRSDKDYKRVKKVHYDPSRDG